MKTEDKITDQDNSKKRAGKVPVNAIVMQDVVKCMRDTAIKEPIKNHSSFATTLLWQIFEASGDNFEDWMKVEEMCDDDIEYIFKISFPLFINGYPDVLVLDA